MKISIIIPVYLVENTLNRCVESVVEQSFQDLEVILVDDGSPDHSPALCDEWAERDGRIVVVHQPNKGLSEARNTGIEHAQGEYITFVDSDDYWAAGTLEAVMAVMEDNDIVEFPIFRFYGSPQQSLLSFTPRIYEDKEAYWLNECVYQHAYACNKFYRRELFKDVRFPKGNVFEDIQTLPLLLQKASRVATTDRGLYFYCWNEHGITAKADGKALTELLNAHLRTEWMDDRYYLCVLNVQIDVYERTEASPILSPRRVNPFLAGLSLASRLKAILVNVFGVEQVCHLFRTIHQWQKKLG